MPELTLLHESTVTEPEIDSLGHMNVRFYITRADHANRELLSRLGVVEADGRIIRRLDTYSRFLREQFEGARLETLGGVVPDESIDGLTGLKTYFEIRNRDTGILLPRSSSRVVLSMRTPRHRWVAWHRMHS